MDKEMKIKSFSWQILIMVFISIILLLIIVFCSYRYFEDFSNSMPDLANIITLSTFLGESSENREVTLKVSGLDSDLLKEAVAPYIERIIDLRVSD